MTDVLLHTRSTFFTKILHIKYRNNTAIRRCFAWKLHQKGEFMIFNILTEPWMGVVDNDGTEKLVGLRDYLVNAHQYKCSAENKQFAVLRRLQQRLAEMVIIDIYGRSLEQEDNRNALIKAYEEQKFDKEKIDAYFHDCIENGCSFDLFDNEKPFLQVDRQTAKTVFAGGKKIIPVSVSSINPRMSSGNNKIFFQHIPIEGYISSTDGLDKRDSYYDDADISGYPPENAYGVTFVEYANLLLLRHCMAGFGGNGYKCGIACVGRPPILYQIDERGDKQTLFSSILLNIREDEKLSWNDGLPIWRWHSYNDGMNMIEPNQYKIPLLAGMMFPVVYIRPDFESLDIENKVIKRIYKTGMPFKTKTGKDTMEETRKIWLNEEEPSVAIISQGQGEKKRDVGLSFTDGNKEWLNIRTYANVYDGHSAPKVLNNSLYESIANAVSQRRRRKIADGLTEIDKTFILDDEETEITVELTAYYLAMDMGLYLSQGKYQCFLPSCILHDELKFEAVVSFLNCIGLYKYQEAHSEKQKSGIARMLLTRLHDIEKILSAIGEHSVSKKEANLLTAETILMNRYWRYCEYIFKELEADNCEKEKEKTQKSFIQRLEELNPNALTDEEYLAALKNILDEYRNMVWQYANQLIQSFPVPKGKTLAVKKMLYRKGAKK